MKNRYSFFHLPIFLLSCAFSVLAAENDDKDLLFSMNYDNYEAAANHSKGYGKPVNFKGNLMLRMHPGAGQKGNALCYNNGENFLYNTVGNFSPERGTVSFWVMPKNWDFSSRNFQMFFRVKTPGNFNFFIYKMHDRQALTFAIFYAGGKYVLDSAMAPSQWITGKWHRIDAVWNCETMALYIDGELAVCDRKNPYVFRQKAKFPADGKGGWMQLGMSKDWKPVDENDLTVIDEVKIYSRMLSADEIRAGYEKIYPRQKQTKHQFELSIPQGKKVVADGKLSAGEWDDAAIIPLINPLGNASKQSVPAYLYLKMDQNNIMAAVKVEKAPSSTIRRSDDPQIWKDDCFEIHLDSGKKHRWQFILNSNGALYDAYGNFPDRQFFPSRMQRSWSSGSVCGSENCGNYWTGELVIPRKSFASLEDLTANFGVTAKFNDFLVHSCWTSGALNFFQQEKFGRLFIDGIKVQIPEFQVRNNFVAVTAKSRAKHSVRLVTGNGTIINRPQAVYDQKWSAELEPGKYTLQVEATKFSYFHDFEIVKPLTVALRVFPSRKKLDVLLRFNIDRPADMPVSFRVEMLGADGRKLTSASSGDIKSDRATLSLALPEKLQNTVCRIIAEAKCSGRKFECEKILNIPDFAHYDHRLGMEHQAPAPWQNITGKNGTFFLTGKKYVFHNGPFPAEIEVFDEKLLDRGPALYCNGKKVEWQNPAKEENLKDQVKLSGFAAVSDRLDVKYSTELWFDGFSYTVLEVIPKGNDVRIDDLSLRWSVPGAFSEYLLIASDLDAEWKNRTGQVREFGFGNYISPYIWLTGREKGFCWWSESSANMLNRKNEKPFRIERSHDVAQVEIKLISQSCTIPGKLVYRMGFMATPGKRFQGSWRKINVGWEIGAPRHETFHMRGFINRHYAKPYPWTMEPWTGLVPYDAKRFGNFVSGVKKRGSSFIPYSQPAHTAPIEKDYEYFITESEQLPVTYIESATEYRTGRSYDPVPLCPATTGAELFLWRADKILADYPELGGLYYDISPGRACSNTLHGHGGLDAFGREYKTSTLYDLRLYFLRLRRILQKHGKDKFLVLHAHKAYCPFTHGMGDVWWPGEQYWSQAGTDPLFYCTGVRPEEYQSIYSPKVLGTAVSFLSAVWTWPMQKKKQFSAEKSPVADPYTISYLTACLLHDILPGMVHCHMPTIQKFWDLKYDLKLEDAKFTGYWENGGYSENTVKISRYELKKGSPFSHVLIVGNIGRKPQKFPAKFKADFLQGKHKIKNLWDDRMINDLKTLTVNPGTFLLLGIAPEPN